MQHRRHNEFFGQVGSHTAGESGDQAKADAHIEWDRNDDIFDQYPGEANKDHQRRQDRCAPAKRRAGLRRPLVVRWLDCL